jgi:nicotinate-nucleotide adenylyltransferase
MKKTGLLFGSFNPLHNGHMMLAEAAVKDIDLGDVCFVVQPENPYKPSFELLDYETRLELIKDSGFMSYEPKTTDYAHYILETLKELKADDLVLILGEDLSSSFSQWKDYDQIRELAEIYESHRIDNISSSTVRDRLKAGQSIDDLVPHSVSRFLQP